MIEPTQNDIGKKVVYYPKYGNVETGIITSIKDNNIFVRYDKQHETQNGQLTPAVYLYWSDS